MIRKVLFAVFAVLLLTGEAAAQQKEASPELSWSELSNDQRALLGNLESQWPRCRLSAACSSSRAQPAGCR